MRRHPGFRAINFSVRWTGQILVPTTGTYRFATTSDDGVRLWVNGQRIINNWTAHSPTVNGSTGIALTAGVRYNIRLDYYEQGGGAQIQLRGRAARPGGNRDSDRAAVSVTLRISYPNGRDAIVQSIVRAQRLFKLQVRDIAAQLE